MLEFAPVYVIIVVYRCIPGVASYALSYACLKSVNYALFFWLPFFLTKVNRWRGNKL